MTNSRTATVLVVDDDQAVCDGMVRNLRRICRSVVTATDPQIALSLAHQHQPDLILLDMNMPTMDGLQLLERLRAEKDLQNIPVLFLSGSHDYRARLAAIQGGALDWIAKPARSVELEARVKNHLERQAFVRQAKSVEAKTEQKSVHLKQVVHDLRAPLTIIQGAIEAAGPHVQSEPARDLVRRAERRSDEMRRLLDEILGLAPADAESEFFRPGRVIDDVILESKHAFEAKGISVSFRRPTSICQLQGRELSFRRIVRNLLSNAIKYSPLNSKIEVALSASPDSVVLAVCDQGVGIPATEVVRLLATGVPPTSAPTAGESSSKVGLSIVRKCAAEFQAQLFIESAVNEGSRFMMVFPKVRGPR